MIRLPKINGQELKLQFVGEKNILDTWTMSDVLELVESGEIHPGYYLEIYLWQVQHYH